MEDPDDGDRRLFLHLKNNLGRRPQGLAFHLHDDRIVGKDEQSDFVASYVVWDTAPVQATADETLNAGSSNGATAKEMWIEFLESVLADGPLPAKEIERQAR